MTAFQNFATEFITFLTVKEWEIQNSIHAINSNLNDFIIVENDDAKMCYEAKKNEKKLQHDEYEIINSKKKENNKSEKKIIKLLSELKSMRIKVLQKIKNRHKNYSWTLSLSSQTRIWVYENQDIESTRNSTVDSQKHWVYENFYRWFSKTLNLQEFKLHTNFNILSTIRVQVTYNLREISQRLHVILLISSTMLELSLLSI